MSETLHCGSHGSREAVLVCVHLHGGGASELFVVPADDEDGCQAWCATCERARIAERGWSDKADAIAEWSLVCSACYQAVADAAGAVTVLESVPMPEDE